LQVKNVLFKYKYVRLKYFICPISFQFRPKPPGSTCRPAEHECDLSEYCNGDTEFCPNDIFKVDGTTCKTGKAYCYQGACRTHTDQVRKNNSWVEFEKSEKCLFHCIANEKKTFFENILPISSICFSANFYGGHLEKNLIIR